jgi:hypothetical protein
MKIAAIRDATVGTNCHPAGAHPTIAAIATKEHP